MNRSEIVGLFDRYVVPSYARYPLVFVRGKGSLDMPGAACILML